MKRIGSSIKCTLALALATMLAAGPAMAEKPAWAGGGKSSRDERSDKGGNQKGERHDSDNKSSRDNGKRDHFEDSHRVLVRDYYDDGFRKGRCPPGLAKKHNGCMPPGQAKQWQVGQQLPRDVVYYTVPQTLVVQIGQPPSGYRYVRVGSDILLIATGTRMILDAIKDLGRS